ncbi:hypothetical protein Bhyg_11514 [Pseudolycoriella hygida]|uniref:Uncharacterized protein n=1 Tax=Pseudolycoriella hygida TaxID=35572 RepID=A0A9Q0S008_9DIPT|nr:hypothetical protein Bhyg_11514 [Pseudolycoriella hygida]
MIGCCEYDLESIFEKKLALKTVILICKLYLSPIYLCCSLQKMDSSFPPRALKALKRRMQNFESICLENMSATVEILKQFILCKKLCKAMAIRGSSVRNVFFDRIKNLEAPHDHLVEANVPYSRAIDGIAELEICNFRHQRCVEEDHMMIQYCKAPFESRKLNCKNYSAIWREWTEFTIENGGGHVFTFGTTSCDIRKRLLFSWFVYKFSFGTGCKTKTLTWRSTHKRLGKPFSSFHFSVPSYLLNRFQKHHARQMCKNLSARSSKRLSVLILNAIIYTFKINRIFATKFDSHFLQSLHYGQHLNELFVLQCVQFTARQIDTNFGLNIIPDANTGQNHPENSVSNQFSRNCRDLQEKGGKASYLIHGNHRLPKHFISFLKIRIFFCVKSLSHLKGKISWSGSRRSDDNLATFVVVVGVSIGFDKFCMKYSENPIAGILTFRFCCQF